MRRSVPSRRADVGPHSPGGAEGAVDEIRERKSAKGRAELDEDNRKRAVAREGLRQVHGGRWGR
ncbi:hypothetical protein [Gordonia namibiensis]|uniref:hypothetical protein n=1 Tax=Gordonia namibiensis TaxID=168480 RepID=UPI0012F6F680|nr:hypothetical protein [Gordonia namibiensis]